MEKTTINVNGMSCEHCVKAITEAVSVLPGVSAVRVDPAAKTVTVEHDTAFTSLGARYSSHHPGLGQRLYSSA